MCELNQEIWYCIDNGESPTAGVTNQATVNNFIIVLVLND